MKLSLEQKFNIRSFETEVKTMSQEQAATNSNLIMPPSLARFEENSWGCWGEYSRKNKKIKIVMMENTFFVTVKKRNLLFRLYVSKLLNLYRLY